MNGVAKGYLQFHAAIIALNSISAIVISMKFNSNRAQFALLFDSFCDVLYSIGPLVVLVYNAVTLFSEESREKYCPDATRGTYGLECNDKLAFMLQSVATETLLGGDTFGTVFLKVMTRLWPLWFAMGRVVQALEISAVGREHRLIKAVPMDERFAMFMKEQSSDGRLQREDEEEEDERRPEIRVAANAVVPTVRAGPERLGMGLGSMLKEQEQSPSTQDEPNETATAASPTKTPTRIHTKETLAKNKRGSLISQRQKSFFTRARPTFFDLDQTKSVPRTLAYPLAVYSLSVLIFTLIQVERVGCPSQDPYWSKQCAVQSYPIFTSDGGRPTCPCHVMIMQPNLTHPYQGCETKSSVEKFGKDMLHDGFPHQLHALLIPGGCLITNDMFTSITGRLTSLRVLDVNRPLGSSAARRMQVSPQIGAYSSLALLSLNHLGIQEIPEEIGRLTAMRTFHARGNNVSQIGEWVAGLTNLKFLKVGVQNVRMRHVSPNVAMLQALTSLRISLSSRGVEDAVRNGWKESMVIPSEIGHLSNIRSLHWEGVMSSQMPDIFAALSRLDNLQLSGNMYTHVPPSVAACSGLRWLNLYPNRIQEWPGHLARLPLLETIDLRGNRLGDRALSSWPAAKIGDWPALEEILLDRNQLSAVPPAIAQWVESAEREQFTLKISFVQNKVRVIHP